MTSDDYLTIQRSEEIFLLRGCETLVEAKKLRDGRIGDTFNVMLHPPMGEGRDWNYWHASYYWDRAGLGIVPIHSVEHLIMFMMSRFSPSCAIDPNGMHQIYL